MWQTRLSSKTSAVISSRVSVRWRAGLLLCTALFGLAGLPGCEKSAVPDGAPERIILILVDTLRRDHVSLYSDKVPTPNIERIAARGQVYTNASSAFHSTTMSMAALFSGHTPSIEFGNARAALDWNTFASCGMSRFSPGEHDNACVPNAVQTLAEDLKDQGYWTAGVVSNKLLFRPYGYDQGFDTWLEVGRPPAGQHLDARQSARLRTAKDVNKLAIDTIKNRPTDNFFLYVHYIDVHDWILFDIPYEESVRRFDKALGDLLDVLESEDLLEGAAVVFTSDHGEMLKAKHLDFEISRHYGNPSFEPLLQVPLIVTPGLDRPTDAFIRGQDIRGLVKSAAGLDGETAPALGTNELLVTERYYQTFRKDNWKSMWKRDGERLMLFDVAADPTESIDLSKKRPDILEIHRKRVDDIVAKISTTDSNAQNLSDEDIDRLRALGYLE
ncbi:MAG: sulfatase [Myxococcota bacterium]|nr:sulfatase [Myxococcota bacterium]